YRLLTFFVCPVQVSIPVNKQDPVRDSIAYMKANIGNPLTVSELAASQNTSASHYAMLFKNKTGSSPIDYFIRLKIKFACQLLKQSELKIGEISVATGYDDVFYFSRIFKKITGSSPSQYRQRVSKDSQ
ncbi:MAG: helix-turn-helix domain-containing protein, partial [Agriterribacter sp.]